MAKVKTPKKDKIVDLKPKAEKLPEGQLKEIQHTITVANRMKLELGNIEARKHPILHKVLKIKPKWGLDFSIDWVDREGNVFEIVHWEWDSFSFLEVLDRKNHAQDIILKTDWEDVGKKLLSKKSEWHSLPFQAQSDYKCHYVGLESERFNDVIWE